LQRMLFHVGRQNANAHRLCAGIRVFFATSGWDFVSRLDFATPFLSLSTKMITKVMLRTHFD